MEINYDDPGFRKALDDVIGKYYKEQNGKDFIDAMRNFIPQQREEITTSYINSDKTLETLVKQQEKQQRSVERKQKELDSFKKGGNKKMKEELVSSGKSEQEADELVDKQKRKLAKALEKQVSKVNKTNKQIEEQKETLTAKSKLFGQLSGGKDQYVHSTGKNISNFGENLSKIGSTKGGKLGGAMSKMGGSLGGLGGNLMGAAGPIGVAMKAIEIGGKLIGGALKKMGEIYEYQAEQQQFENKKKVIRQQLELTKMQNKGEEIQAVQENVITKAQNEISKNTQLAVSGNAIVEDARASATEITHQSLTDISGGAFAAASKMAQIKTAKAKWEQENKTQNAIVAIRNYVADVTLNSKKQNIAAKNKSAEIKAETEMAVQKMLQGFSTTNFAYKQANDVFGILKGIPGVGGIVFGALEAIGEGAAAAEKGRQALEQAELESKNLDKMQEVKKNELSTQIKTNLENSAAQFTESSITAAQNMAMQMYNQIQDAELRIEQSWIKFSQTVFNTFQKSETAAFKMGRALGFNEEHLNAYAKNLAKTQITVSQWGKTLEDMEKLQSSYQETTGRSTIFSEEDFNKSFANGMLMGDDVVGQLNAGMEPFNKSVADSNEMFYEMYMDVTKMGLSGRKYAKDLVNNLKLANKYNFKGGVKSLMEMSKWAQNVRFNTGSLDGMLDKVQEGGLEGIIKQSAELQVLGGQFAMGADPMAMAYEAYMDPEAYAKRLNGMIAGQGVMSSETGEVSFGIASQMIMRQMAKSTGQDYKDVLAQAKQQVKVNKLRGEVNSNFDETQLAAIANNAKYENGEWMVTMADETKKNIGDLTAEDVSALGSGDDPTKSMDENIASMRSTQEKMDGTQKGILAKLEHSLWEDNKDAAQKMITNINDHFEKNFTNYADKVNEKIDSAIKAQESMVTMFEGETPSELTSINRRVETLQTAITMTIARTNDYLESIAKKLDSEFSGESNANQFLEHFGDAAWIKRAATGKGKEAEIMKDLYANFESTMASLGVYVDKNGNLAGDQRGIGAINLLARFNNNESVANVSQKTVDALAKRKLGNWQKSILANVGLQNTPIFARLGSLNIYDKTTNDGFISQNGSLTRIDSNDQVLAAKSGGPIDKMLDMVQPRPMAYDSYVIPSMRNGGFSGIGNNGKLKIDPININLGGNLTVNGKNIDIAAQLDNKEFQGALMTFIFEQVAKTVNNTGKMLDPLYNRIQNTF
jgi:hypothetical protein